MACLNTLFMVLLLLATFILGYLLITLEHAIHINKAAIALITAVLCWTILVMNPANKDAALNAIIDTSEDAIGDFLIQWKVGIDKHRYETTTKAIIHTTRPHQFYVGQSVAHSGVEAKINGNKAVTEIVDPYTFRITTTSAPVHTDYRFVIPNGIAAENDLSQFSKPHL